MLIVLQYEVGLDVEGQGHNIIITIIDIVGSHVRGDKQNPKLIKTL